MGPKSGLLDMKTGGTGRDVQANSVASNTIAKSTKLTVGNLSSRMAWLRRGPRGRLVLGAPVRLVHLIQTTNRRTEKPWLTSGHG